MKLGKVIPFVKIEGPDESKSSAKKPQGVSVDSVDTRFYAEEAESMMACAAYEEKKKKESQG